MHGEDSHLLRTQPLGQAARMMFEQDAQEALQAAHHGSVQHGRSNTCPGTVVVAELEALGEHESEQNRAALPAPTEPSTELVFELRTVERAFSGLQPALEPGAARGGLQCEFGAVPHLVRSCALLRAS